MIWSTCAYLLLAACKGAQAMALPSSDALQVSIARADIGGIDTAVKGLNASVTEYKGGFVQALPLLAGVTDIHLVNRKAYADSLLAQPVGAEGSGEIVVFIENSVGVSIPSTVQNTISKSTLLVDAGLASVLVQSLKLLKNDHDTYSASLSKAVDPSWAARAAAVVTLIDVAIQTGIDHFSQS